MWLFSATVFWFFSRVKAGVNHKHAIFNLAGPNPVSISVQLTSC